MIQTRYFSLAGSDYKPVKEFELVGGGVYLASWYCEDNLNDVQEGVEMYGADVLKFERHLESSLYRYHLNVQQRRRFSR